MEQDTKGNGIKKLAKEMVKECKSGPMVPFMKGTGKTTRLMAEAD